MKAAVLYQPHESLKIEELDLAKNLDPDQVLVKLKASGVCHSDWHVIKGEWPHIPQPTVLGHEGSGVVEAVGSLVRNVKEGDHVILSWKQSCGICEMCQNGYPNLCEIPEDTRSLPKTKEGERKINKMAGLGTFGEYTIVPEVVAVPIDKDIPFPQASLIGCGVMTGVGAAINTAKVRPGSTVAVFGSGGVGLNCIQGAAIAGADVIIAVDILDNKLERAKSFGATHTVNSSKEDAVASIKEITGGAGSHYAFEAIGLIGEPFVQSMECTRRRGITVFVGHAPHNTPVTMDARTLMYEKTVIASMYGSARPHIDFPRLINLYKAGKLKLDELVTRTYPLDKVNDAFDALAKGEVARSVLNIE